MRVSHSAPYHPQSNGIIERSFRTLKERLRAFFTQDRDISWLDALPFVQGSHNSLTRESLGGVSPAEVMFGFRPRWERLPRLDSVPAAATWLHDNDTRLAASVVRITAAVRKYEKKAKTIVDQSRTEWSPKVGDLVFVSRSALGHPRSKLEMEYFGPVKLTSVRGRHTAQFRWGSDTRTVAVSFLKPCRLDPSATPVSSALIRLWRVLYTAPVPDDAGWWSGPDLMDEEESLLPVPRAPSPPIPPASVDPVPSAPPSGPAAAPPSGSIPPASSQGRVRLKIKRPLVAGSDPPISNLFRPAPPAVPVVPPPAPAVHAVRAITFLSLARDARPMFTGTWEASGKEKQIFFWADLLAWDAVAKQWSVTDAVIQFFMSSNLVEETTHARVLQRLDRCDLPGLIEEARYSLPFRRSLVQALAALPSIPLDVKVRVDKLCRTYPL